MILSDFKLKFYHQLGSLYDKYETGAMYRLLIEHFFGFDSIQVVQNQNMCLDEEKRVKLEQALERLKDFEPIQYITGVAHFYDLEFKVKPGILIPRQETEVLIHALCSKINNVKRNPTILDIGSGSGCIAISLAKNVPGSKVVAVDLSDIAIDTTKENSIKNQTSVDVHKFDIINPNRLFDHVKFDIIVSNPPYVMESEKLLMHRNVLDFEPGTALYVKDSEPLIFYDSIILFSLDHLAKEGILAFEINEKFGPDIKLKMEENGFDKVEIIKDLNMKDRFVIGYRC